MKTGWNHFYEKQIAEGGIGGLVSNELRRLKAGIRIAKQRRVKTERERAAGCRTDATPESASIGVSRGQQSGAARQQRARKNP